jgi:hypothetical protein
VRSVARGLLLSGEVVAPNRREFLVGAGAIGATACVGEVQDDMTQGLTGRPGPEPWKMWGSSAIVQVDAAGATEQSLSQQLSSVRYKRPETWSFLLTARLLSGATNFGLDQDFEVDFFLQTGLGLNIEILGNAQVPAFSTDSVFARFIWRVPAGQPVGQRPFSQKWTTKTFTPPTDDTVGAGSARELDWFPAQNINCTARCVVPSAALGPIRFQVGAYFAPRSHVRPDWFLRNENLQFKGGEINGE